MILDRNEILLNDLILLRSRAGIATVAEQLLTHFPKVETELRLVRLSELLLMAPVRFAFAGKAKPKKKSASRKLADGGARKDILIRSLRRYSQWIIDPLYRPELFHDPDMLALPMGRKSIATIPDLSVLLFPHWHPAHRVKSYRRYFTQTVARTDCFLSISETSKVDFCQITGIAPERVTVGLLAPRPQFVPQSEVAVKAVRSRLARGKKYFLFLSTLEPRKNIPGLLDAWEQTSQSFRNEHQLLLVGAWGWEGNALAGRLASPEISKSVSWLGSVDDESLVPLVAGAEALVYPSFYEGFGLPPLEAMACGTPVISSDRGALREVLADAAWIIDPDKPETIREAMEQIGQDAASWRAKGLAHVEKFSWSSFARTTAQLYRQMLK